MLRSISHELSQSFFKTTPTIQYGQFSDCSANTWDGVFVTASLAGLQTAGRERLWCEQSLTVRAWPGLALVLLLAESSDCSAWSLVRRQWEQTQTRPQLPRQLPSQSGHSGVRKRSMSWARECFVPQHFTILTCFVTHYGGNSWLIQIGTIIVFIISCLGVGPREMESLA